PVADPRRRADRQPRLALHGGRAGHLRPAQRRGPHGRADHARGGRRGAGAARDPARRRGDPRGRVGVSETLRIAISGIAANKLRSGLTILGMTIGVAAVIILVAVGNGSKQAVQARIDALGSNVLLVQAFGGRFGPGGASAGTTLTPADADALQ